MPKGPTELLVGVSRYGMHWTWGDLNASDLLTNFVYMLRHCGLVVKQDEVGVNVRVQTSTEKMWARMIFRSECLELGIVL